MNIIDILRFLRIAIPKGAVCFHTDGLNIVFMIHEWSVNERHFQGSYFREKKVITESQFTVLQSIGATGSWGVDLPVSVRGYQP